MATTYQIVPYLVHAHVRGKPNETRPVDDLDARGAQLQDVILRIFDGVRSRGELVDPKNAERKLRVQRLSSGASCVLVELEPGRSGISSQIEKPPAKKSGVATATTITRDRADTEYIPARHAFYFAPGSHQAILLAERVGVSGAITFINELISKTAAKYYPDLVFLLRPAMTGEVMRELTKDAPVKTLVFTRPRPTDTTGATMMIGGEQFDVEVRLKAPRRQKFQRKALRGKSGEVDRDSLVGILSTVLANQGDAIAVQRLLDANWSAATEVTLPNGAVRTIDVSSSDAVTMSFPIEESHPSGDRPSDEDFAASCVKTLEVFEGSYGVNPTRVQAWKWQDDEWEPKAGEKGWEVVWE